MKGVDVTFILKGYKDNGILSLVYLERKTNPKLCEAKGNGSMYTLKL